MLSGARSPLFRDHRVARSGGRATAVCVRILARVVFAQSVIEGLETDAEHRSRLFLGAATLLQRGQYELAFHVGNFAARTHLEERPAAGTGLAQFQRQT